eukprot:808618-Prorocentrum_lima.AAC.1
MFPPGHDLQLQGRAVDVFAPEHVRVSLADVFDVGPVAHAAPSAPAASCSASDHDVPSELSGLRVCISLAD